MCPCVSRREFLGCSMAGGVLLASQMASYARTPAFDDERWPKPAPIKIHSVFVGRTGGIYLSRPEAEIGKFREYLGQLENRLGDVQFVGGELIPPTEVAAVLEQLPNADGVLMFHLEGHGGGAPWEAMQQIVAADLPTAVFSQPYSGHGWMRFPEWQKEGKKVVSLPTSDWSEIDRVAALMRVPSRMRQTKILVVRGPQGSPAACDGAQLKERWGAEMIPITVDDTLAAFNAVDPTVAEAEAEAYWLSPAKKIVEPSRQEIIDATRLYLAMKDLMIAHGAQAITSSNCMGEPAKGCLAFSKLNDMGLVGACEGDMDSTLTMLMFAYGFGVPGFITDPVFDTSRNALIHFHCTSATRMDGPDGERLPFTIRTQSDSDRGVSLDVENRDRPDGHLRQIHQPRHDVAFHRQDHRRHPRRTGVPHPVLHRSRRCTQHVPELGRRRPPRRYDDHAPPRRLLR